MTGPEPAWHRAGDPMTGHTHQYDTNGDRYRCPVTGCWWTPTGVQAMEGLRETAGEKP